MLEFGAWLPDQAAYTNAGATDARNVLALTNKSYGPLGELSSVSDALPSRPQGAAAFRDSQGDVQTFAGDVSDLYTLVGQTWDEISKSTGAYTTASDDAWKFIQYGERVIGVNGHQDQPQDYVMGTDTVFGDLSAAAPRARHIAVINNFVMMGNTYDSTDGSVGNRVWWSAIDNPTDWPVIGSSDAAVKQSDRQDLPTGGWVQSITGAVGGADGAVFCEKSIYRVTYVGAPLVFEFNEVERDRGTPASNSVVNVGPFAFYLGEDGFYSFNGSQSTPIGNQQVDKHFFADLDQNYFHRIYAAADPINKIVFWSYPGAGNTNGRPNKLIMYNWEVGRWSYGEVENELMFRDLTDGYTLEELDAFGTIDTLPFSLDSRVWTGGSLALSAFDSDNKLSRFSGDALEAIVTTTEFGGMELFQKPNERMYVDGVRPYVDGGTYTVSLTYRDAPNALTTTDGPNAIDANGMAHFTRSCRYARITVTIAAASVWTHALGVDMSVTEDGKF